LCAARCLRLDTGTGGRRRRDGRCRSGSRADPAADRKGYAFSDLTRPDIDDEEIDRTSDRTQEIVPSIPGFISLNSYASEDGEELLVARFDSPGSYAARTTA
jgi:hypothetical protein